jgi:3-oxoacyl-[acyl-carrier protein] reductase
LLAERGVELGLVGRHSEALRDTAARARAVGSPRVLELQADLGVVGDLERVARAFIDEFGGPDAVIHNAGIAARASIEETLPSVWDEQLRVNLSAPFLLTRALLPAMRQRGKGHIVFVGSISSTLGTARLASYCASKWGVLGLMKSLAAELSGSGLMTCAVLPGSVDTDMLKGSGFPARMNVDAVARTLTHYALDADLAHNGASIEMFGT